MITSIRTTAAAADAQPPVFHRYVAIGDSATEGLEDPDPRGGYRGWADRLAMIIAAAQAEPLEYANLAIRGLTLDEIRTTQFDRALDMEPDLMTIVGGVNDVLGLRPDFDQLRRDFAAMFGEATARGIRVATLTMPDPAKINPLGGYLRDRMLRLNEITQAEAARYGVAVLALADFEIATDPRMWAADRLHGNPLGHERVAHGLGWLLGIPGEDLSWTAALAPTPAEEVPGRLGGRRGVGPAGLDRARRERVTADLQWARTYFGPWLVRGIRGIPHGLGVTAKRPVPTVVEIEPDDLAELRRGIEPPPVDEPPVEEGVVGAAEPSSADPSVTSPAESAATASADAPTPAQPGLVPLLSVPDARTAVDWYRGAFGAEPVGGPRLGPDGRTEEFELTLGGVRFAVADADPAHNAPAPGFAGTPVTLCLVVGDGGVDTLAARAAVHGAIVDRDPADDPGGRGRSSVLRDPFGHRWLLHRPF